MIVEILVSTVVLLYTSIAIYRRYLDYTHP